MLSTKELDLIKNILAKYKVIEEAYIFGSRAHGDYRPNSDVDLAIKGKDIDIKIINALINEFYDSSSPYTYDIVHIDSLSNKTLKKEILENGFRVV